MHLVKLQAGEVPGLSLLRLLHVKKDSPHGSQSLFVAGRERKAKAGQAFPGSVIREYRIGQRGKKGFWDKLSSIV